MAEGMKVFLYVLVFAYGTLKREPEGSETGCGRSVNSEVV